MVHTKEEKNVEIKIGVELVEKESKLVWVNYSVYVESCSDLEITDLIVDEVSKNMREFKVSENISNKTACALRQ